MANAKANCQSNCQSSGKEQKLQHERPAKKFSQGETSRSSPEQNTPDRTEQNRETGQKTNTPPYTAHHILYYMGCVRNLAKQIVQRPWNAAGIGGSRNNNKMQNHPGI